RAVVPDGLARPLPLVQGPAAHPPDDRVGGPDRRLLDPGGDERRRQGAHIPGADHGLHRARPDRDSAAHAAPVHRATPGEGRRRRGPRRRGGPPRARRLRRDDLAREPRRESGPDPGPNLLRELLGRFGLVGGAAVVELDEGAPGGADEGADEDREIHQRAVGGAELGGQTDVQAAEQLAGAPVEGTADGGAEDPLESGGPDGVLAPGGLAAQDADQPADDRVGHDRQHAAPDAQLERAGADRGSDDAAFEEAENYATHGSTIAGENCAGSSERR